MNKEIVMAKVEERENDLIELNQEYLKNKKEFEDFVEKSSLGMLPHIQMMKNTLRVSEQIQYTQQKIIEHISEIVNYEIVKGDEDGKTETVQGSMEEL